MKADIIIDHETQKVKLILDWKSGNVGQKLTASLHNNANLRAAVVI